jgi:uncharacterized protein (TIGR00297 family)
MTPQTARKLVHMAFGFCALLLKWLTLWQAAAFAIAALIFNVFILPHVGGKVIARNRQRGFDAGIIIYPLAVLALLLIFPRRPDIAGTVWAILAFGDGAATLFGTLLPRAPLPWNREKSWAGLLFFVAMGLPAALFVSWFLRPEPDALPRTLIVGLTVLICALVESLPTGIDDNIEVPVAGAAVMFALTRMEGLPTHTLGTTELAWIGANAALAALGYAARSVNVSGMVGGFVLGVALIVFGGWELYAVLLAFFVIGTTATKLGYRRKAALGLAQERGGRRGFNHAFANVGLAALLALLIGTTSIDPTLLYLMAAAALATATADTAGSEIGQLLGRRAFLPLTFRRVERGTEGAVSIEGTLATAAGALVVAAIAVLLREELPGSSAVLIGIVAAAGFAGAYLESILGSLDRLRSRGIPNDVMNFINTMFGAAICALLWNLVYA